MPGNGLLNILGTLKDMIFGKSKTRALFDKLKNDPANKELAQQVKELFRNDPVTVITEILRRVSNVSVKSKTPTVPSDSFINLRQTWENTIHRERVQPLQYLRPTTKQELIDTVIMAEKNDLLVRAVGKGHSFSDVSNATDILVDMLKLNKTLALESDTFKANLSMLFSAEAGMLVADLNDALDKQVDNQGRGRALPTMAAFDQETIYGAVATSTHGTGLNVAGMAAMVRSMDIVAAGGICYRLERTNGITDPQKFKTKYPGNKFILIQDDDKFHSSVVGFGLMGIVYSLVIEPVKTFYLIQRLWVTDWDTVKQKFSDRSFFSAIDDKWTPIGKDPVNNQFLPNRAQVFVNPYITKNFITQKDTHTCVVQIQVEISKAEYDGLLKKVKSRRSTIFTKIADLVEDILSNGSVGVHEEKIATEDKNSIVEDISTGALLILLNDFPLLTPLFLDISMIVLLSGSGKFGKSYEVMNQGKLAIKNAGYSTEPGFAVDNNNNFVAGAEEMMRVVALSESIAKSFLTAPVCMRFVKESEDYLSPEYKTDTCMIDVPLMLGTIGDNQMLERMQLDLVAMGARPHWGKICNLVNGEELLRKMYPKYQQFTDTVSFFNPKGTFNSSFSFRTGISKMKYKRPVNII